MRGILRKLGFLACDVSVKEAFCFSEMVGVLCKTSEVASLTIMKSKMQLMNGCECKSPILESLISRVRTRNFSQLQRQFSFPFSNYTFVSSIVIPLSPLLGSRDGSFGIATGWTAEELEFGSW
jgi:hypothetical protein